MNQKISSLALIANQAASMINFRRELIEGMVRRGIRVYAFAPDFTPSDKQRIEALGAEPFDIRMERTGTNPLKDIGYLWRLHGTLRRLKPDATFAYFIKPVIYGNLAAFAAGVSARFCMIEGAGYTFQEADKHSAKRWLLRHLVELLYRVSLKRASKVFFLNEDDVDLFVECQMVRKEDTLNLGGIGVDLSRYHVLPPVTSPVTFILMARLIREKGICEYAKAARMIKTTYPETRFLLLGGFDPNPGSLTEKDVKSWMDEGIIEWPGQVDDIRPWVAEASVYVLPSYYREGVPRSTQEAMAMGRAIITTDWVGCRDTVTEGLNGFLIPIRDHRALAEAMRHFIESPQMITEMGAASRKIAEEKFDIHKVNTKIFKAMGLEL